VGRGSRTVWRLLRLLIWLGVKRMNQRAETPKTATGGGQRGSGEKEQVKLGKEEDEDLVLGLLNRNTESSQWGEDGGEARGVQGEPRCGR
jgi:hypothetical protein